MMDTSPSNVALIGLQVSEKTYLRTMTVDDGRWTPMPYYILY